MAKAPADFVWADGVRVAGTRIWCDAARANGLSFLAHAGVAARHRRAADRVLCTERTLRLLEASGAAPSGETLVAPFGRPFAFGRARLELLPSGRMPGAAQLLVQLDGRTLLYAGDARPDPGRLAEPAQLRPCDVLALALPADCDGAAPQPPSSSRSEREAALVAAVQAARSDGKTAAVLVAPLAAAEAAVVLAEAGVPLAAHARVAAVLRACRRLGLAVPSPAVASPRRPLPEGGALLWPRALAGAASLARLPATVAVDAGRLDADADLPSLVDWAAASGAREVLLVGAHSVEGARAWVRAFAGRRLPARALGPPQQMRLW